MHQHALDPKTMSLYILRPTVENPRGSVGWSGHCASCDEQVSVVQFNEQTLGMAGYRLVRDA